MAFVSFAQNHEDTILWRALKHVRNGTYVDVGAYDPDVHSVTKAFYSRGWRGVNVEPVRSGYDLLRQFRPLDVNLNLAVACTPAEVPFFHVLDTGLSTLDPTIAARHRDQGWIVEEVKVPAVPLREVWDRHVRGDVHFLKIDTEGAERDVLASLDLTRQRPWIVVVEATVPLTQEASHLAWERILLDGGYSLATEDGLNRYYLAQEHLDLLDALARPLSIFDEAVPESEHAAVASVRLLQKQRDNLLRLVASQVGSFDARQHAHLAPYLSAPLPTLSRPASQLCTQSQFEEPVYPRWCSLLREEPGSYRKQWEFVYILQTLWTRGLLRPGTRLLGFGCGTEPLAAAIASFGCEVVATDLDPEDARSKDWRGTDQHAAGRVEALNDRGICPPSIFARNVRYRNVDMNDIPADLRGFDGVWSSCALEHIGSIRNGLDFIRNAMACLKSGGSAVHTTEFNLTSNEETLESPALSFFRACDLELVAAELIAEGHEVVPFNFNPGDTLPDRHVDLPPFDHSKESVHLRLKIEGCTITSVGLACQRGGGRQGEGPADLSDDDRDACAADIEKLGAEVEANPRNPALFLELARVLGRAGDSARARQCLEVGLDQNPQSQDLWQAIVDQSAARGDAAAAAQDAQDALAQLPFGGGGEWHIRVARALLARGEIDEARAVLDLGIDTIPGCWSLRRLRAALGCTTQALGCRPVRG